MSFIEVVKKNAKNRLYSTYYIVSSIFMGGDCAYGGKGYFKKSHPVTGKYTYANWGSRIWEYAFVEKKLNEMGIDGKTVVDIGIGLPSDSNFYSYYVKSGCYLKAYDLDSRLSDKTVLSEKCAIYNKSSERMDECPDSSVDVVIALSSFEHFPIDAFRKTMQEIHRILKPGGAMIVTLDLTFNKGKSAPWAILEKTMNGLPPEENRLPLGDAHKQLTLEAFIGLVGDSFMTQDEGGSHENAKPGTLLYSKKWNSYIAYIVFYKK